MQTGSVVRNGKGWRGRWWEDDRLRSTRTVARKGDARALLNAELRRLDLGDRYRPPITFAELCGRYLAQHPGKAVTIHGLRKNLKQPVALWGTAQAADLTAETIQRWLVALPVRASYRYTLLKAIRSVYNFGVRAKLVDENPARLVRAPYPPRGENVLPFENWDEVERVAGECGRWASLVVFMADCGARPAEIVALEHKHVDARAGRVYLPGTKTDGSRRVVHLTDRGLDAYRSYPRSIATPLVWHAPKGGPITWQNFRWDYWYPALDLAGLERRPPYALRHFFAVTSIKAGVAIHDLARELGHTDVSRTFRTYTAWIDELGPRAANLRSAYGNRAAEPTVNLDGR